MNDSFSLFSKLLNHFKTLAMFFHWLICVPLMMAELISSRMCLLTTPISDLEGLSSQHVGWSLNAGLWSFNVINASFFASFSISSSNLSCLAMLADCPIYLQHYDLIFCRFSLHFLWSTCRMSPGSLYNNLWFCLLELLCLVSWFCFWCHCSSDFGIYILRL